VELGTDAKLSPPMSKKRMWLLVGVAVAIACIGRMLFTVVVAHALENYSAFAVAGPNSSGSPGCSDLALVPGYFEVVQAGYRYSCVATIPDSEGMFANTKYEIAGQTDTVKKTIAIVETDGVETFTQAHETGHALADIYQDTSAEAYYLSHTGLDHWSETSFDDYFNSGAESFAETYAVCTLGVQARQIPFTTTTLLLPYGDIVEYKIGSCETLNMTLEMMKHPN
jgi:hypothetical protein